MNHEWQRRRFLSLDADAIDKCTGQLDHTMPVLQEEPGSLAQPYTMTSITTNNPSNIQDDIDAISRLIDRDDQANLVGLPPQVALQIAHQNHYHINSSDDGIVSSILAMTQVDLDEALLDEQRPLCVPESANEVDMKEWIRSSEDPEIPAEQPNTSIKRPRVQHQVKLPIKFNLDPRTRTKSEPGASLDVLEKHGMNISDLDPVVVRRLKNTDSARRSREKRHRRLADLELRIADYEMREQQWESSIVQLEQYRQWELRLRRWLSSKNLIQEFESAVGNL
jgi:hypothetical protein